MVLPSTAACFREGKLPQVAAELPEVLRVRCGAHLENKGHKVLDSLSLTPDKHIFAQKLPSEQLVLLELVPQSESVRFELSLMLKNLGALHVDHAVLPRLQAVQVCLSHTLGAYKSTKLCHLIYFHLVGVRVSNLACDLILMAHELKPIS